MSEGRVKGRLFIRPFLFIKPSHAAAKLAYFLFL
jgi:hypothetical protein